jgi:hypothetical protein
MKKLSRYWNGDLKWLKCLTSHRLSKVRIHRTSLEECLRASISGDCGSVILVEMG